ncbi:hypothetical protein FA889_04020 [Treponema pallidum]|nr:hypothetical protein FFV11_04020 [Treponema pallidum subsp. pallidum]QFP69635.1 hypothetical protein FA889_04020 [Treponema pallidum]QFP74678.1 hypothetical protein FA890_04020 [Treponema pallidum]
MCACAALLGQRACAGFLVLFCVRRQLVSELLLEIPENAAGRTAQQFFSYMLFLQHRSLRQHSVHRGLRAVQV